MGGMRVEPLIVVKSAEYSQFFVFKGGNWR